MAGTGRRGSPFSRSRAAFGRADPHFAIRPPRQWPRIPAGFQFADNVARCVAGKDWPDPPQAARSLQPSPGRAHSRLTRHTDSSDVTTTLLNPAVQRGQCWAPIRGQSSTPIDNSSTSFLCRRRIPLSIRLVSRDGAKSPMSEHRRRLPMLFIMRPERASVNCRLESKNCSREIRMRDHSFPSGALSILPTNAQMRAIVS